MKRLRAAYPRWITAILTVFVLQTAMAAMCVSEATAAPMQLATSHCESGNSSHGDMHQNAMPTGHDLSHQACAHCDAPDITTPAVSFALDIPVAILLPLSFGMQAEHAAPEHPASLWQATGPPGDRPLYLTTRRLRI